MSPALIVDGLIALVLLLAMVIGWRQGAFTSILSTVGVVAGLVVGAAVAPPVMQLTDSTALRFLLGLGTIVLLLGIGNLVGGSLGASLRGRMRMRASQNVDSAIGSIFSAAATLLVVWLISISLATGLSGPVNQGLRSSHILGAVHETTPPALYQLPARISAMLDDSGLPPLFAPFDEPVAREVDAPSIHVEDVELVESVRPSVIHVMGDSDSCRRRLMGSGFVTAPDYVVTNAHVVAGTEVVRLDTTMGVVDAEVVYYNPGVDVAVLYSPNLNLPALPWANTVAETGQEAIVMGFPESGPFEAAPARIRDNLTIAGPDIYASGRIERDAYTVRGTIRQGNSGGPMLAADGSVLGVVFGASVDHTDTGYALTADEVQRQIGDVTTMTAEVSTQECVAK